METPSGRVTDTPVGFSYFPCHFDKFEQLRYLDDTINKLRGSEGLVILFSPKSHIDFFNSYCAIFELSTKVFFVDGNGVSPPSRYFAIETGKVIVFYIPPGMGIRIGHKGWYGFNGWYYPGKKGSKINSFLIGLDENEWDEKRIYYIALFLNQATSNFVQIGDNDVGHSMVEKVLRKNK
ncbi:hypothetical protein DSCO28_55200 [Desulfosarcina ovata subsp. sediminis]|uniref:Uncharacterized protein n=2 Tax=Desulfosarcina ovata TaxID=83564 RepID=A0A5K7ZXR5_9BACT|nr:hypothetical protein DSCO28_55200 [Desulfosarcina ovata subsp. sediminis]